MDILPSNTVTISVPQVSGRDGHSLGPDRTATFDAGVHIDGNRMTVEDGTVELVRFTNALLEQLGVAREIVEPERNEDDDNPDDFAAASDECEEALNSVTPNGWYWGWDDGDFRLSPPAERVGFAVQRLETDCVIVSEGDGDFYPEAVSGFWMIEVYEVDEDGDFGDCAGTFSATWAGGRAVYLNLYSAFYDSGREIELPTSAYTIAGPAEALSLGDERSPQAAEQRLIGWLRDYADGTDDSDWGHDAPHYGFPSF